MPRRRKIPHPMTDKYINANKKGNYRIVIYKHEKQEPHIPTKVIVLICATVFALSFVLASIFLI